MGPWIAASVIYLGTLGFIGFVYYLNQVKVANNWSKSMDKLEKEMQHLRDEMSQLAMSVGLRRRGQPTGIPPTMGNPNAG